MKKLVFFVLIFSFNVFSSGIPTADVAAVSAMINENLKNLEKQAEQIIELKNQLEMMKQQAEADIRRFEGNLGKLLNIDSLYSIVGDDLSKILLPPESEFEKINDSLREKYGLKTDDLELQKKYDFELKKIQDLERSFDASVKRTQELEKLRDMAISAKTPTEKQDIANEIAYHQAQLLNESMKQDQLRNAEDQNDLLKTKARNEARRKAVNKLMDERWN